MLKLMGEAHRDEEPERRCPWDRGPEPVPGVGPGPRSGRVSPLPQALSDTGQTQRGLCVRDLSNGITNSIRPSLPLQELATTFEERQEEAPWSVPGKWVQGWGAGSCGIGGELGRRGD